MQAQLGSAKKQASRIATTASFARCTCQAARQPSRRASTSAVTLDDPSFFFYPSYTAAKPSSPRSHSPSRTRSRPRSRYSLLRRYDSQPLISSRLQLVHSTLPLLPAVIARSQSTTSSEACDALAGPPSPALLGTDSQASGGAGQQEQQSGDLKGKGRESGSGAIRNSAEVEARLALVKRIEDLYYERGTFQKLLKQDKLPRARQIYEAVANDLHSHLIEFPPFEEEAKELVRSLQQILPQLIHCYVAYSDSTVITDLISFFEESFYFPEAEWSETPTTGSYNMLLQTYVQQLNVSKAFETVARLKRKRRDPTVRTWTLLITLYSHKRDSTSARNVFEEMLKAEIEPTQHSYTALMNAYVEAGQWGEAVKLFRFLDDHPVENPLKPDIQTWTTLIKAYVLMGAPIDQILNLYREILHRRLSPQPRTFTLMLQAACDAGQIDLAEEIFAKMDSLDRIRDETAEPLANVYSFSVMIRGLMRAGQRDTAGEYFDEMRRRGIEPTSATWSILISAYAKGNESDSAQVVRGLLDDFMETYMNNIDPEQPRMPHKMDPSIARGLALQSVYGPVITAYAQAASFRDNVAALPHSDRPAEGLEQVRPIYGRDKALKSLQEMLAHPHSKPSIATYTALLDAYRRVDDVEGMLDLWKVIVDFALDITPQDYTQLLRGGNADDLSPEDVRVDPSRRNLLCLPLSILINGLSANHRHELVAEIWAEVQHRGFGYDASNFNHLAVAFIRAGELWRAFWTVETVILQPELELENPSAINREDLKESLDHPLNEEIAVSEDIADDQDDLGASLLAARVDTPIRPPNRAHEMQPDFKNRLQRQHIRLRLPEVDFDDQAQLGQHREPELVETPATSLQRKSEDTTEIESEDSGGMVDAGTESDQDIHSASTIPVAAEANGGSLSVSRPSVGMPGAPNLQQNITTSFQQMTKARKKALWTVHAATLTQLELALIRLERKADEGDTESTGPAQEQPGDPAELAAHIRANFPLTIRAIEQHRAKLDLVRGRLLRP